MELAPVVLFVYNRLEHTIRTIEALSANNLAEKTDLIIYSDGWKNEIDIPKVLNIRSYLGKIKGFKNIEVICREKNLGLSNNIISGVTDVCNKYGKVIVLEDDLLTSKYFLTFMNQAIDKYIHNKKVCSIHAYVYPTTQILPETFFIKGADCWGWATWSSAWETFETNGSKLLTEIKSKKLDKEFNFSNSFDYIKMLENQVNGNNNSWAIRWYASCFLNDLYTLYPGKSLVSNIGFDDSGTHSGNTNVFNQISYNGKINIKDVLVRNDKLAYTAFVKYFRKNGFYESRFKKTLKILFPKRLINLFKQ